MEELGVHGVAKSWTRLSDFTFLFFFFFSSFPSGSDGKESACNAGGLSSIPGLGRSPGGGHGNPFQYSCLEDPMDRGTWLATVYRVTKRVRHDLAHVSLLLFFPSRFIDLHFCLCDSTILCASTILITVTL